MTEKQQIQNYIKLMKAVKKYLKNHTGRVFTEWVKEDAVIYISNGHFIFPIPEEIYITNCVECKLPSIKEVEESKIKLKKLIMDTVNNNPTTFRLTTLLFNLGTYNDDERLANVYKSKISNDFIVIDKRYADLIKLLPPVLSDYEPCALNTKSPIVGYTENYLTMGYAVLPINADVADILDKIGFTAKE